MNAIDNAANRSSLVVDFCPVYVTALTLLPSRVYHIGVLVLQAADVCQVRVDLNCVRDWCGAVDT